MSLKFYYLQYSLDTQLTSVMDINTLYWHKDAAVLLKIRNEAMA